MVMKRCIFWDITPCSPLKMCRLFGGKFCLDFQARRICQAKKQHEAGTWCWFLVWFTLRQWRWRQHVPPKRPLIFNRLRDIISQKIDIFLRYYVLMKPSLDPKRKQINPFYIILYHFFKIHSNIIPLSTCKCSKWSLLFRFSDCSEHLNHKVNWKNQKFAFEFSDLGSHTSNSRGCGYDIDRDRAFWGLQGFCQLLQTMIKQWLITEHDNFYPQLVIFMFRNHSNIRCFIINPADKASLNKPITKQSALLLSKAVEEK
jgi:hypothetical protein